MDNISKIQITKEVNINNPESLRNIKKNVNLSERNNYMHMDNNQVSQYNRANINNNIVQTNNGYQIMMKTNNLKQKTNYEMDNKFNNTNPNNRNMIGKKIMENQIIHIQRILKEFI